MPLVAAAALTATIALVRADRPNAAPGPIVLTWQRRSNPDADSALLRVTIDPPPAFQPRVTFTVAGDPSATVSTHEPHVAGDGGPVAPVGEAYLHAPKPGHAVVTAHVGAPYDADVKADVFTYGAVDLSCSSPGESLALGVDARGNAVPVSGPADADVYLALSPAAAQSFFCRSATAFVDPSLTQPVIRFPLGAVRVDAPVSAFGTVSARDWKNATSEVAEHDMRGTWLIRSRSGATIKLVRGGAYAVAPPGGEFADRAVAAAALTPVVRVALRAPPSAPRFRATVAAVPEGSLFAPYGARPGQPLLIGVPPRAGYTEQLFGGRVAASLEPPPYVPPAPAWRIDGPLENRGERNAELTLAGTRPGTGRVTATFAQPPRAAASLPVIVYRSLAIGCTDIATGYGVAFEDDGTARVVAAPSEADLFASYDAQAFRCGGPVSAPGASVRPPTPFTPGAPATVSHADDAAGWYFPYGGTFFPNGDDPARSPPPGSRRGVAFDAVTAALWRNDRTSVTLAEYRADADPCYRIAGGLGSRIPNCTTMKDSVLLIRTRRGRYVKLLSIARGPGAFAGLYEVSRPDGTFATASSGSVR